MKIFLSFLPIIAALVIGFSAILIIDDEIRPLKSTKKKKFKCFFKNLL